MLVEEALSFALDRYNVYPSEEVTLYVRLAFPELPAGCSVQLALPTPLQMETYRLAEQDNGQRVSVVERAEDVLLVWQWEKSEVAGAGELAVRTRVQHNTPTAYLSAQAALISPQGETVLLAEQRVYVRQVAQMMNFLPEIYRGSDFTNRFLMLFESFWRPISERNDAIHDYFDPNLTPASFLPWLGSWFGLTLEEDLPEERKRRLLAQIAPIYASRGTHQSLITFLNLYTGGEASVTEHVDENFILSDETHLGYSIALGTDLTPNTFDVALKVPQSALDTADPEQARQRYRRRLESLITSFQPAHTIFHLNIEYI